MSDQQFYSHDSFVISFSFDVCVFSCLLFIPDISFLTVLPFLASVRIDNVPKQCAELLYTYNLYNRENDVGPDSRHVAYFIMHCH